MAEYYRHSGRTPPAGAIATTLVGIACSCILAIIYSFAIVWIPFIYLNILLTVGFGGATGAMVALLGQRVRIRNTPVLTAIALAAMAVGYYVAWGADLWARAPILVEGDTLAAWNPTMLWAYVQVFYEEGGWSIGSAAVSGIPLACVWLIEAGMLFVVAVFGVLAVTGDSTYCEQCDCWSQKKEDLAKFTHADELELRTALEQGDFSRISARPALPGAVANYLQIDAFVCPSCDDHCCLNVVKVTTTINSEKENETSKTTVVDRIVLDAGGLKAFMAATLARPAAVQETIGPPQSIGPPPTVGPPPSVGPPQTAASSPKIGPPPANPGGIGPPPGFKS